MTSFWLRLFFLSGVFCGLGFSQAGVTYTTSDYVYPADSGFYNVRLAPYNCFGDGVHDDTACIQAAIAASFGSPNRNTGTVYFPSGTYLVSDTLYTYQIPGNPANITASVSGGCITGFTVISGGSGYFSGFAPNEAGLLITGGGGHLYSPTTPNGPGIFAALSGGSVTGINKLGYSCVGQGYTSAPTVKAVMWRDAPRFEGQNKATTIIKLANNASGFTSGNCNIGTTENNARQDCKAVIHAASNLAPNATGAGNEAYQMDIWDLTINTGIGNAGAIAIDWQGSNRAAIKNCNIISGDTTGRAGISLGNALFGGGPGPGLIKNVSVQGFDYGGYANVNANQVGVTWEYIDFQNQHIAGFLNGGMPNWFREVSSTNTVPVFVNGASVAGTAYINSGMLEVIDGTFTGGSSGNSAIQIQNNGTNQGVTFLRNITATGYLSALATGIGNTPVAGSSIAQFSWPAATSLFPSALSSVNLSNIPNTPEFVDNNFANWADVVTFGADRNGNADSTTAVRNAAVSGKNTLYFPTGTYNISGTVSIPNGVRRMIGLDSVIVQSGTPPMFACNKNDGTSTEFRNWRAPGGAWFANNTCTGDIVFADLFNPGSFSNGVTGVRYFLENTAGTNAPNGTPLNNIKFYARQFDHEGNSPDTFTGGSTVWIFGHKTEGECSANGGALVASNSTVELLGAWHSGNASSCAGLNTPLYKFTDTLFSISDAAIANPSWTFSISEARAGVTRTLASNAGGYGGGAWGTGLFSGQPQVLPTIPSFTATPQTITPGASTTLAWTTTGAPPPTLTLNPGAIDVTGTTSRIVTPAANTTYTLTATNSSGSVSSSVTVFLAIRRVGQEAGIQFSSPPTNPFCQYGEYQRAPAAAFGGTCSNFLKMYDIFPSIYNPDQSNQSIPLSLVNQYAIKVVWTDNNTYNGYGAYLGDSTGLNIADVNFQNYYWGNYTPNVTIANFQTKTGTTVTTTNPLYISADAWFEPYSTWGANVNGVRQTPVVWAAGYPQNATAWSLGWQAFITAAKTQAPSIRLSPHIATQDPIVWVNFHTIYGDCPAIEKEHFPLSEPVSDANHRLQVYNAIVNFYWFANVATPVFPNIANEPPTRVTQWGTDIDQTVSTDVHTSLALYALSRGTNSFFDLITTGNITADPTLWQPTATLLGIINNAGAPTATVIATGHVLGDGFNLMVRTYPGGIAYYNMTGTVQHPVPPPGAKDWVGNPVTSLTLADGQGEVLLTAAVPGPTRISGAILHAISVH